MSILKLVFYKSFARFSRNQRVIGWQLQKFCIFLFFPQINKLLGDTYKSLLCFLKLLEKWVAKNSLLQKVSYVFPLNRRVIERAITKFAMFFEIVKKMGGQKLVITNVSHVFSQIDELLGGQLQSLLCFFRNR